jgi:hypothetical protein
VPVVAFIADVDADVVQQRPVLQPFPLPLAELVDPARLIEERQRELRDVPRVLGPLSAPLSQFDDAAPSDVGVALDLSNPRRVAVDVVEHESLAEREVAQRELFSAKTAEQRVEENRATDRDVGAPGIEARHVQARFDVDGAEPLPDPVDHLCGDAPVSKILQSFAAFVAQRERPEAEDRA